MRLADGALTVLPEPDDMKTLALALIADVGSWLPMRPASPRQRRRVFGAGRGAGVGASQRGASEATTSVVVRVASTARNIPWLAVVGVDPFTKAEQVRSPPR